MTPGPVLQWTLTGVFAVCGGLYVARTLAAETGQARAAWCLHALLAVAMIAMVWPSGVRVSAIIEILIFTAGALYFAYLGLFTAGVGHSVYRSVMMASMVLMAVAAGAGLSAGSATPIWVIVSCGIATTFFLGAALRSFYVVIRGPQRPGVDLLMATGMGVSFAALIV